MDMRWAVLGPRQLGRKKGRGAEARGSEGEHAARGEARRWAEESARERRLDRGKCSAGE